MNKCALFVLVLLFSCVFSIENLAAADKENFILGSQWAKQIDANFKEGKYGDFITKIEARFQEGVKSKEWTALLNEQKKFYDAISTPEGKKQYLEVENKSIKYRNELCELRYTRNQALLSVAIEFPNEFVSSVIRDLASNEVCTPSGRLGEMNEVIFKVGVMHSMISVPNAGLGELSAEKTEEYGVVLDLYKFQQLLRQEHLTEDAKNALLTDQSNYIILAANNHDEGYLKALANRNPESESAAEQRVASIMNDFDQQKKELMKRYNLS